MALQITAQAAAHIKQALQKRGSGEGLRLSIKVSGCSGYQYLTDYAEKITAEDEVFEQFGAKVIIDRKSYLLVEGTTIDFQTKGLNKVFVFDNPRAQAVCGCGESFTLS